MPKSKRTRVLPTSAVTKKPARPSALALAAHVRAAATGASLPCPSTAGLPDADAPIHALILHIANLRTTPLQAVRRRLAAGGGRLFLGRRRVLARALADAGDGAAALGGKWEARGGGGGGAGEGEGVVFTREGVEAVREFAQGFCVRDFVRAGAVAERTVVVPAGAVETVGPEAEGALALPLPRALDPDVRRWGMATRLEQGRVVLDAPHTVCRAGDTLDAAQAALLKALGVPLAEFRVRVVAYWDAERGEVRDVDAEGL